ncbi:30S ribosome-binding factor RbfA [Candidatus Xianfuyuplasma coldseepsis]|uniref:Ribosome-binding factor A n=1 Tax=Candidatus Xianfuyuplasma coldseepsis TaxID=2782163 RepID=A0A7L7KNU7_9MOLU|nr:30S ribosome-binding factor RbfA [Xianfuyuplasma coldseepsis]QMS84363.1 30S ribosome-binding factor RbfA [Xianfuyuplasma coldseepsis]
MSKLEHLQTTILRSLTDIYRREVKDDAIGFMTITEVRLTNDYSYLTIYYTILGKDEKKQAAHKALERSKGFVRSKLAQRVKMRKVPELMFKYDESLEYGNRIEQGLKNVLKK